MTRYKNSTEGHAAKVYDVGPCKHCGSDFEAKAANALFCSGPVCRKERAQAGNARPGASAARAAARVAQIASDAEALALHNRGDSYIEIGAKLGITKNQAGHSVRRARGMA